MSWLEVPSPNRRTPRFANMTIGRKLVAIVIVCVGCSFILMVGVQITGTRADLHDMAYRNNLQTTELLAAAVAGGVRWQQPEALERSYRSFMERADSELASIVTMDVEGRALAVRHSEHLPAIGLSAAIEDAEEIVGRGDVYAARDSESIIIVAPVVIGLDKTRVGTLAVGWSLQNLNGIVAANLDRQVVIAGFALVALVIMLLALLSVTVTHPLRAVSRATMLIAQGEDSVPVPETKRGDEIGEMARSLEVFKHHIAMLDEMSAGQEEHRRKLSEALENERKYNALHREFVSMASHEFRTPLAIIDGAAQRITRRADRLNADELLERVGKIRHAVTRMTGLIDSTLSASRMEAGCVEFAIEPCDFRDILETVCRRQREIAPEHDITVDLSLAPKLIDADPKQLDQVFTNLLSNAVKYSPDSGRIDVVAASKGGMAVISVRDRGVGIPEAEMPKLFERFFRASTSTGIPGTGIGLNLAKQLVEMHGGEINVASIAGHGSTFTVHLPISAAAEGVEPQQADDDANPNETKIRAVAQR